MLAFLFCGEFLLHIPCCLRFYLGSFSSTSRAGFPFLWEVSLTHPVLPSVLSGKFVLNIPYWFLFFISFFTHPKLASSLSGEFLLHIPCCRHFLSREFLLHIPCWFSIYLGSFSYTSHAVFIFILGVSLTHPVLVSFLSWEFLLHIPCWLSFSVGSFSDISHADFVFIRGVSLTHPMLAFLFCVEFLLHIP